MEKFEESTTEDRGSGFAEGKKPSREIKRPSLVKIDGTLYFISGPEQVFNLNSNTLIDVFARELTAEEIADFPESIIYTGEPENFKVDHEMAFRLLALIIYKMNEMQPDEFLSFPLASFIAHLTGYLYNEIMDFGYGYDFGFVTSIVLSGAGNTFGTGKSLMTSMWQITFDGHKSNEQGISITNSALFSKLDRGIPYYSKYCVNGVYTHF